MLWVLKRTVSVRRFFCAPKNTLKIWVRKYLQFYADLEALVVLSENLSNVLSKKSLLYALATSLYSILVLFYAFHLENEKQ